MGLASLNAALSGLRISQQQINVISNNIANVGTLGFTRKILPQSSQAINGVTVGVAGETIIRNVDLNLSRDLWTQVSSVGNLSVKQAFLDRIEKFHGPPDQEISVAAELTRLLDSFAALSDIPEDQFLQAGVVDQAQDTANRINSLAGLITTSRNDAQDEMASTVTRINDLLLQIADLNEEVRSGLNTNQTVAQAQDERDIAIGELSELIDISFFQRGDGVLVIQTNEGVQLADTRAETLFFDPQPVAATTFYPDSVSGVFIGDPLTNPAAVDITGRSPGGRLGGLIELRDEIFPQQMAQIDELAHKLALRFEAQGLRLFTNDAGIVPADAPPDPSAGPPAVAVPYVGFATVMRVNADIINDHSLIQRGTAGEALDAGSNVVISRVIENVFGDVDFQLAAGAIDIRVSTFAPPTTLQDFLGTFSSNHIEGTRDLTPFATIGDLVTSAAGALDDPNDQFEIIFEEARLGLGPTNILVDLSVANGFPGANATEQMVNYLNAEFAATFTPAELAGYNAVASVGSDGQIVFDTRASFSIDSTTLPTGIGQPGLDFLGLFDNAGSPIAPTDPYFDVQVGNGDTVRITIEPGDTELDLITKLQTVPGLAIDLENLQDPGVNPLATGFLSLRPGNDFVNPDFGGDIKITGGPFQSNGAGANAIFGAGTIPDGLNVVSSLFGSFQATPQQDLSPVQDMGYMYETFVGSGVFVPFREDFLGPGVDVSTEVIGSSKPIDFLQKMITRQTQEITVTSSRLQDENTLRNILQDQLLNESGVNLDEELSNLIIQQTAFNASARVVSAVDELFQELLNAVR